MKNYVIEAKAVTPAMRLIVPGFRGTIRQKRKKQKIGYTWWLGALKGPCSLRLIGLPWRPHGSPATADASGSPDSGQGPCWRNSRQCGSDYLTRRIVSFRLLNSAFLKC